MPERSFEERRLLRRIRETDLFVLVEPEGNHPRDLFIRHIVPSWDEAVALVYRMKQENRVALVALPIHLTTEPVLPWVDLEAEAAAEDDLDAEDLELRSATLRSRA